MQVVATDPVHLGESPPGSLTPSICWPEEAPPGSPTQDIGAASPQKLSAVCLALLTSS